MKTKYLVFGSLFFMAVISGCYTVIQHPDVESKDEYGYTQQDEVMFYDDCNSCHKDGGEHKYTAMSDTAMNDAAMSDIDVERAHRPYDNSSADEYYNDQGGYYDYGYYGNNIGYYYNYPWWYGIKVDQQDSKERNNRADNKASRENSRERSSDGGRGSADRRSSGSITVDRPAVSAPSSGNSSSTNNSGSETRSKNENTSSSERKSSDNNSSGKSSTRNNDGGRSSGGSGRR